MAVLVGRHLNKIDRKGRVSVPKAFRDFLAADASGYAGFYAYPLFTAPAIEACGESFMARVAESIDDLALFSEEQDDLNVVLLESTHQIGFDPEGRVSLPAELIEHAGITDQALFVGRGHRFQIWNPESHATHSSKTRDRARSRGATLKLRPPGDAAP